MKTLADQGHEVAYHKHLVICLGAISNEEYVYRFTSHQLNPEKQSK
jgi:hypothetical protein